MSRAYNSNNPSHWNGLWEKEGKGTWRIYPMLFTKAIEFIEPNTSLIDFGCGNGIFLSMIKRARQGMTLMGLDISDIAVSQLKEFYDIDGIVSKLPEVPNQIQSNSFDYVTIMDTLEHVENEKEVMNAAFRILKLGGKVLVGVPYDHSDKYKKWIEEETSEHIRWYDEDVLKNALTYYGKNPQIFILDDLNIKDGVHWKNKFYLGVSEK